MSVTQPRDTYLTTTELANELGLWQEQVKRWCRSWFGKLDEGRRGPRMGYRIPLAYRYVARAWMQVEEPEVRRSLERVLAAEPKDWVVLVGKVGSTHYTLGEALTRLGQVVPVAQQQTVPVYCLYVGDSPRYRNQVGPSVV